MSGRDFRCCHQVRKVRSDGFTLMEVLLVLVILVALGAIAVPIYREIGEGAKRRLATVQVAMFEDAIDAYEFTTNKLPEELVDLTRTPSNPKVAANWSGPYLKDDKTLIDPWEGPYQYEAKGVKNQGNYDVWSNGRDQQIGTNDDIGNWE